jgi:hypothetical protein
MLRRIIPFAIKSLLNGERGFGGGQPCGLAAAPQNITNSQSETLGINPKKGMRGGGE